MPQGRLIAIAAILILLGFGVAGMQQAYFDAGIEGGATECRTETTTVTSGGISGFGFSNDTALVYSDQENVSVHETSGGDKLIANGNWTWNQARGIIEWNDTVTLADGTNVDVDYCFAEPTDDQEIVKDISKTPTTLLGDELIMLAVLILIMLALGILVGQTT